jgi:hypothetical protein
MSLIPVGYGQARLVWQRIGAPRESIVTFGYNPSAVDPSLHAAAIYTIVTASNRPCIAASMDFDWQFLRVDTTEVDEGGEQTGSSGGVITGSISAASMTPQCAILITKNTALGGRRNRGRMYVPPIYPEEQSVDYNGTIGGTQRTNLQTRWDGVLSALAAASIPMVILHRSAPFTPTEVTSLTVQSLIATQRRRLRK